MSKNEKKEKFKFERPKKHRIKYFFYGFLISTIVVLLLSGIFVLTLITVLK